MKKHLLAAVSLSAIMTASAFAADLPSVKAAQVAPAPMWTGFYAGLNSGYGWGLTPGSYTQASLFYDERAILSTGSPSGLGAANSGKAIINQSGYLGGGQIGFNYQFKQRYLLGVETDMQGSGIAGQGYYSGAGVTKNLFTSRSLPDIYDTVGFGQTQASLNWFGTLRGRAGYLITPSLLTYVTGGLSYGGVSARNYFGSQTNENQPTQPRTLNEQQLLAGTGRASTTMIGWNIGGGAEWMVASNWSIKSEILYYNLGSLTFSGWGYSSHTGGKNQAVVNDSSMNFAGIIARAGLNYHLNTSEILQNPASLLVNSINTEERYKSEEPPAEWSGLYAGLNSGYGWSGHGVQTTSDSYNQYANSKNSEFQPGFAGSIQPINGLSQANSGWSSVNQSGFIGGLQAGYNIQLNKHIVAGLEADIQGSTMQGAGSYSGASKIDYWDNATLIKRTEYVEYIVSNGDIQAGMNWYGSVRGRFGYLITPKLLVYGSGGLSYGGVFAQTNFKSASNYIDAQSADLGRISFAQMALGKGQAANTLIGWVAGAGTEWMFLHNWSLKAEALYYDLGNLNLSASGYSPATDPNTFKNYQSINTNTRIRYDGVITRMGVNYHFEFGKELPIIAKF